MGGEGTPGSPGVMQGEALRPHPDPEAIGVEALRQVIGDDLAVSIGAIQVRVPGSDKCAGTLASMMGIAVHDEFRTQIVTKAQEAVTAGVSPEAAVVSELGMFAHRVEGEVTKADLSHLKKN